MRALAGECGMIKRGCFHQTKRPSVEVTVDHDEDLTMYETIFIKCPLAIHVLPARLIVIIW